MFDTTEIIEDSIVDAQTDPDPVETTAEAADESDPSASEDTDPTADESSTTAGTLGGSTAAPASTSAPVHDQFAKDHGLPPQVPGARENRIPYSRVKSISDSAVKKALAPVQTELTAHKQKVTEYEQRLAQVGQFEHILQNDPEKFLNMLTTIPAYRQIFDQLSQAAKRGAVQQAQPGGQPMNPTDQMPQPNADGQYDIDGLRKLLDWNAAQVEKRLEQRYKPIEDQWQAQRRIEELAPQIQAEIDAARKWPKFTENEEAITRAIASDSRLSLEGAYRQTVFPTLVSDRDKMRAELLEEIKKAPTSTASPAGATRPAPARTGPKTTEQIILDSIKDLPGR